MFRKIRTDFEIHRWVILKNQRFNRRAEPGLDIRLTGDLEIDRCVLITGLTGVQFYLEQKFQRRIGSCSNQPASSPLLHRFNRCSNYSQNCPRIPVSNHYSVLRSLSPSHRSRRRSPPSVVTFDSDHLASDLRRLELLSGEPPGSPF